MADDGRRREGRPASSPSRKSFINSHPDQSRPSRSALDEVDEVDEVDGVNGACFDQSRPLRSRKASASISVGGSVAVPCEAISLRIMLDSASEHSRRLLPCRS